MKYSVRCLLFLLLFAIQDDCMAQVFLDSEEPIDSSILNAALPNIDTLIHNEQLKSDHAPYIELAADKEEDVVIIKTEKKAFLNLAWNDFLQLADSTGKNYLVQFTASWCGPCRMMEKEVFKKESFIDLVNANYLAIMVDIDDFDGVQITQDMRVKNIPATIIFDCTGRELRRIEGFQYEDMFLNILKKY